MRNEGCPPARDRTAILGSIAIHCCVLLTLAAVPRGPAFPTGDPDERALLASRITVERAPPRPRPTRPPPRPYRALVIGTPPPLIVTIANAHARRAMIVAAEQRYAPPGPAKPHTAPHATSKPALPVIVARQTLAPVRVPAATATPASLATPAPTPSPAQVAERESTIGIGNLGDTWPARPMPGMVAALRAKMAGHATVRVDVDEHGRPIGVTIISGLDDPATRSAILQMLNAATYIPARCNGLDCAETMTLML